jgi:parallel beta-helix repeat protein
MVKMLIQPRTDASTINANGKKRSKMRVSFATPILAVLAILSIFCVPLTASEPNSSERPSAEWAPEPVPSAPSVPLPSKDSRYRSTFQSSIKGFDRPVPSLSERLIPLPPRRLDVKEFGAKGDGRTDDTMAIRRALVNARGLGGATLYFPAGVYNFAPQDIDEGWSPETFKSGKTYAVFSLSFSNVALVGDGPKKTILSFHTLGMTDPATHFWRTGESYSKIKRGAAFIIWGGTALTNIQLRDMRVTGNAPATGDATVGGNPTTGDGWDLTNKGMVIFGRVPPDNVVLDNVEFDSFRGEILWCGGGGKRITIANCYIHDSNASAISMSADVYVANTRIAQTYNGFENFAVDGNQKTVIINSLIDGFWGNSRTHNGVVFIGVSNSGLYVSGCTIQNCANGIYLAEFADNITIQGNVFSDNLSSDIFWKAFDLYPKISKVHYNNTWIDSNLFQAPATHRGQAIYDPVARDTPQHNLVVSNNIFTQVDKFFVDSSGGITPENRSNFEIFGNQFISGRLWEDVGPRGNRALWHDNDFGGLQLEVANSYSEKPVVVNVDPPGAPLYRINAFWSADSTISLAKSVSLYPAGFELTLLGPTSHGHSEKEISIRPDPSWNNLSQDYPMGLNAKLVLKKDATGRFSFVSFTPGTGW